jgi:hypothetical protein
VGSSYALTLGLHPDASGWWLQTLRAFPEVPFVAIMAANGSDDLIPLMSSAN